MFTLQGNGIGNDVVIGKAWVQPNYTKFDVNFVSIEQVKLDDEVNRFKRSISSLEEELKKISNEIILQSSVEFKTLIESHRLILNDPLFFKGTIKKIYEKKCNAEWALVKQLEIISEQFNKIENPYFKERKHDLEQLVLQLISILSKNKFHDDPSNNIFSNVNDTDNDWILLSQDLTITELPKLSKKGVLGFAIELGSPTSHIAILSRSLGIPSIVGIQSTSNLIKHGETIILDSQSGVLIVGADNYVINIYREKQKKEIINKKKLEELKNIKCETKDGIEITLMANIEQPDEAQKAKENGALGIGLLRSEFLFLNKTKMPSEEEQFLAYKNAILTMKGFPVSIRTLDYGADKLIPFINNKFEKELNPALGQRAIRFCLDNEELFLTQIRAILRASFFGDTKILLPLITNQHEIIKTREIINIAISQLRSKKIKFDENIKVGAMIEVPSAAIAISSLLPYLDFASLGTNDLIQYTLAIDRTNSKISNIYDPSHPAILNLIKHVVKTCNDNKCPISICGELAGDVKKINYLLKIGLRNFSMNYSEILKVKEKILNINLGKEFN